jgi:hypothetical protein
LALKKFAETVSLTPRIFHGSSRAIQSLWKTLREYLFAMYQAVGRRLRLFIDLSTCPRYLSLGVACNMLSSGLASHVTVFYAEGNYSEDSSEESRHELFTKGGWDAIPIPSLEGEWAPNKRRAYLVSVGFEGSKTLRLISREEPDDIYVLFPDPGVKLEYVQRAREQNKTLMSLLPDPSHDVIRAAAGDAIDAWKQLDVASREQPSEQNVYYVCCGTKSHSLALALRALVLRYPAVLYILPDQHKVAETHPLGVYWRFDIKDVTAL